MENKIAKQREFFFSQKTKNVEYRIEKLKKLKQVIKERENEIYKALERDLGKSSVESYMAEIGMVLEDLCSAIYDSTDDFPKCLSSSSGRAHV